ncbi:CLC_0170 family protein [Vallitalea guaymasensis]|uniref:Uncharacterized protein n=1 Tax=Vallitalea guaymasensis TaxID=1185412 RepID=A0A8J8SBR4_9FIRM|nr:CLC_0170 family protein [Vallitalea guaymasensis]QUH29048.1 hypothetical protein HYG85_08990 [Vallitalea guaymasensis]
MTNILEKLGNIFSVEFIVLLLIAGLVLLLWDRKVLYRKKMKKEHTISIVLGIIYVSAALAFFVIGRFI